ncbi:hypothetical protein A0H81_07286 [Grifola frondosa]|uniref:Uncharacterized protein n=1 Tax=Grifola frondosa TaxID=5627 RepID=A0A1C7M953_GRIFR|nr:hypothetical protein A0H81_07286 [Grifola frondosa]
MARRASKQNLALSIEISNMRLTSILIAYILRSGMMPAFVVAVPQLLPTSLPIPTILPAPACAGTLGAACSNAPLDSLPILPDCCFPLTCNNLAGDVPIGTCGIAI